MVALLLVRLFLMCASVAACVIRNCVVRQMAYPTTSGTNSRQVAFSKSRRECQRAEGLASSTLGQAESTLGQNVLGEYVSNLLTRKMKAVVARGGRHQGTSGVRTWLGRQRLSRCILSTTTKRS